MVYPETTPSAKMLKFFLVHAGMLSALLTKRQQKAIFSIVMQCRKACGPACLDAFIHGVSCTLGEFLWLSIYMSENISVLFEN